MTPREALASHIAQRPEMPRPFNPNYPEAIAWQRAYQWWVDTKERLQRAADMENIVIEPSERTPRCLPHSEDYVYREPMPRKRKRPPRPAWSGASSEYGAQRKRESRARQKERNEAAAREAMAERKIA
jgi:hypothetical protein